MTSLEFWDTSMEVMPLKPKAYQEEEVQHDMAFVTVSKADDMNFLCINLGSSVVFTQSHL